MFVPVQKPLWWIISVTIKAFGHIIAFNIEMRFGFLSRATKLSIDIQKIDDNDDRILSAKNSANNVDKGGGKSDGN